jgi:hypothetical protein
VQIGEKPPQPQFYDDNIKREIPKWIDSVKFTSPISFMIIKWNIPVDQLFVNLMFSRKYLIVDLQRALGVSAQELISARLELGALDVNIVALPRDHDVS